MEEAISEIETLKGSEQEVWRLKAPFPPIEAGDLGRCSMETR